MAGVNPVGDLVKNGQGYYRTLKGVGPVEQYEISSWSFDYVWLTELVETMKISSIKIQYMDLLIRIIKYNDNMYIGQEALSNLNNALNEKKGIEEQPIYKFTNISADDETIYSNVEQMADFGGGINKFRSLIQSNFDLSKIPASKGVIKSVATFVVEKDGTVSDVKAEGDSKELNDELVNAVKGIKGKWTPGKINAVSVRSKFTFPITINAGDK